MPGEQHLFEPPPAIEVPPPTPVHVRGHIKVRLEFEADVAGLAHKYADLFEQAGEMEGYQSWEKGSVFLWELVAQQLEVYLAEIPGLLSDRSSWNDPEIEFGWTRESAALLDQSLGVG
jgi:hypothetical protein